MSGPRSDGVDSTATPIVHVGLGAFARAHLGTYAQDLIEQGEDARITAVSLRSSATVDALVAQGGRYTVVERDGLGGERMRRIDAVVGGAVGPAAAIELIAAPACRLVTLTVTEAGYGIVPGRTGVDARLDRGRPDVAADLRRLAVLAERTEPGRRVASGDEAPATVPGVLVLALDRRRAEGISPPVVASLDNVSANGASLRASVLEAATVLDADLATWIRDEVAFPSSVVDRIVPATSADLSEHLAEQEGIDDAIPVLTEPHRSWAIEASHGPPPLEAVGVEVVNDVAAHERRKLWLLNAAHSALALVGLDRGHETIADAVADPVARAAAVGVQAEALEVADLPASLNGAAFVVEVLERFANPVLGHRCAQVATDSEHKLPLRIVPVVEARLAAGLAAPHGLEVIASFLARADAATAGRFRASLSEATRAALDRAAIDD